VAFGCASELGMREADVLLNEVRFGEVLLHNSSTDFELGELTIEGTGYNPKLLLQSRSAGHRPHRIISSSKTALILSRRYATKLIKYNKRCYQSRSRVEIMFGV
jgi:hypothetical protein